MWLCIDKQELINYLNNSEFYWNYKPNTHRIWDEWWAVVGRKEVTVIIEYDNRASVDITPAKKNKNNYNYDEKINSIEELDKIIKQIKK